MKTLRAIAVLMLLTMTLIPMPAAAFTGTATESWSAPATFVSGAALNPATDLYGYKSYCSQTKGGPYTLNTTIVGGLVTSATFTIPVGTTYCVVTAVTSTALGNLESGYSNEASKTVTAPLPGGCTGNTMN